EGGSSTMKSKFTPLLTALLAVMSAPAAMATPDGGIDAAINSFFAPIANAIFGFVFYPIPIGGGAAVPAMVLWLIIAATFFTAYFGFINLRGMKQGVKLIRGDYSDPNDTGEVSHFQALATALSGTVGLGNIAGV